MRKTLLLLATFALLAPAAHAEVARVDISARSDVGASGYEKIVGTIHFALDPGDPHNRVIVDLDRAPRNAQGRVEFSADLYILRPKVQARGNGVALVEVVNRGRKTLTRFNRGGSADPSTEADLGDGFLTGQGYTLVSVGWQFDVSGQGVIGLQAPVARGVSGIVRADTTPNQRSTELTFRDLAAYLPSAPGGADTTLTVRTGPYGSKQAIPRARWQLDGQTVTMADGFEPGRTYELSFLATDLPVAGVGLAAFRDTASWLKHDASALAPVRYAYTFGASQSGRFLRSFLYEGFNSDEQGRQVFDGVMAHIAGASRIGLNERGASPSAASAYDVTNFPFTVQASTDPIGGTREGLLDNDRARANQPKVFFTNTSVEYWNSRSAALIHTSPNGTTDVAPPDNVRIYFLTGTQHSPGRFPPRAGNGQQPDNPVEYWWTLRALLTAMDHWVRDGTSPPDSRYPMLADGTLVRLDALRFPELSGVQSPAIITGAQQGDSPLPQLVPQVDADGNERAGIRAVEHAVPVATYTGWNFRSETTGAPDQLVALSGASVRFPATAAARASSRDPRRALAERYPSRQAYLDQARAHADALVEGGYLLAQDVPAVMTRMEELWDYGQEPAAP